MPTQKKTLVFCTFYIWHMSIDEIISRILNCLICIKCFSRGSSASIHPRLQVCISKTQKIWYELEKNWKLIDFLKMMPYKITNFLIIIIIIMMMLYMKAKYNHNHTNQIWMHQAQNMKENGTVIKFKIIIINQQNNLY